MAAVKTKNMALAFFRLLGHYEVKTISNSTFYKPGDWLPVATVTTICDKRPDWDVTSGEPDIQLPIPVPPIPLPVPLLTRFGLEPVTKPGAPPLDVKAAIDLLRSVGKYREDVPPLEENYEPFFEKQVS